MKRPPHDLRAEQAVLAGVMLDPHGLDIVADILDADDWYSMKHQAIWAAILVIHAAGATVDHIALRASLIASKTLDAAGGDEYVFEFGNMIPPPNLEAHANIVRELADRRRMITTCTEQAAAGYETALPTREYLDAAEGAVFAAAQERVAGSGLVHCGEALQGATRQLVAFSKAGSTGVTGLPTGLHALDTLTTGFHPGELIVIAGRPGMGKSAVATKALVHAARQGVTAAMFSLEMPTEQLMMRMICAEAGIDLRQIRKGQPSPNDLEKWSEMSGILNDLPIHIDETPACSLLQVRSRARRLKARKGLGLVIIDYLQLMRSGMHRAGASRETEVGDISRGLKVLAKELRCPVIALAQLNRQCESRSDKRPMLSDLRESGSLEQDADAVIFVYRDDVYNPTSEDMGTAELIIRKQRNGPINTGRVKWDGEYTRFSDLGGSQWSD